MSGVSLRNQRTSFIHGGRHAPRGSDPSMVDAWVYVGEDVRVPFLSGSNASPNDTSPIPAPLAFRLCVGPPNDCEYDVTQDDWFNHPLSINEYHDHQIEIVGDVTDVNVGDTVFILPMEYRFATDKPLKGHDDDGNYVPCRLLSTGEFVWGVP